MDPTSRDEALSRLQQYQEQDLRRLRQHLDILNREIGAAEMNVANYNNLLSAARGVVGMRGGAVDYTASKARRTKSAKSKQRLWTKGDATTVFHHPQSLPPPSHFLVPIGMIYTTFQKRFEAPRQSFTGSTARATIVLTNPSNVENGFGNRSEQLKRLRPGMRLWIIYWFDRNASHWRPLVRPPRAKGGFRVGLFATRSPNRPTPIGLSLGVVEGIEETKRYIHVSGVDVLDETPLMALKRYDELNEAFFDTRSGWLDDYDRLQPLHYDPITAEHFFSSYTLHFDNQMLERIDFVNQRSSVDIQSLIRESLRRIPNNVVFDQHEVLRQRAGSLPIGSYRVNYVVEPETSTIHVTDVISGMRRDVCEAEAASDPEAKLHLEFQDLYHG